MVRWVKMAPVGYCYSAGVILYYLIYKVKKETAEQYFPAVFNTKSVTIIITIWRNYWLSPAPVRLHMLSLAKEMEETG